MALVRNTFTYDADPSRVWALVTDLDALAKIGRRFVTFDGLPKGRIFAGQKLDVMVRLFGRLPAQPYQMDVIACDDTAMRFESHEIGAGVKRWNHKLWLTPDGGGTTLDEEIDIDAGLMTPIFAGWAKILYRGRHNPRTEMLNTGEF